MRQQHIMFCHKYIELDFNGEQAAIAAGYSKRSARQIASRLLTRDDVKLYLQKLLDRLTMDPDEVIRRLTAMARGEAPTSVRIDPDGSRKESYGAKGALDSLAKAHALFTEKRQVSILDGLEIIDDD